MVSKFAQFCMTQSTIARYGYVALTGSKFLGLAARQIPIYRAPCSNFGTRVRLVRFHEAGVAHEHDLGAGHTAGRAEIEAQRVGL